MLKQQGESRDAAIELAEKLDVFLHIIEEYPGLYGKPLSKRAVDTMLLLIADVTQYVNTRVNQPGEALLCMQWSSI